MVRGTPSATKQDEQPDIGQEQKPKRVRYKTHAIAYLSPDEARQLLKTPYQDSPHDRALLGVLLKCGLRASEAVSLKKRDIYRADAKLIVRMGKGGKTRFVPIPPDLLEILARYIDGKGEEDIIFPMRRQSLHALVRRYGKRAGIQRPIYPHMLRHTFAVQSLKAGVNLRTLQRLLGHSRIDTTEIYLQLTDADVDRDTRDHPLPY